MKSIIPGLLGLLVCVQFGCVSGGSRQPVVDFRVSSDYASRRVRDIAVLPPTGSALNSTEARALPASELRVALRRFLIDSKHYAVPKEEWVDAQLAQGSEPFLSLNTDALLEVDVQVWDTSSYESHNAIYFDASFTLKAPDGTELWSYITRDQRLALPVQGAGDPVLLVVRRAAQLMVERVVDTLPRKPTIVVD